MIRTTPGWELFNVLNDEFVAGLIGMVQAHYRGHILFTSVRARLVCRCCALG